MQGRRRDYINAPVGKWRFFFIFITLCLVTGCDPPEVDLQTRSVSGPPKPIYAESATATESSEQKGKSTSSDGTRAQKNQSKLDKIKPEDAEGGGTLGDIILTPLRTYSKVKVKISEIQIQSQLNTFRATNGGNPKDFAEYKKKILDPVGITLPELPDGDSYVYQPEKGRNGEVMIRSTN